MKEKSSNFYGYLQILLRWRKFILRNVVVVTLLAVVISLLITVQFTATATMLPPTSDQGGMLGLLSMNLPSDIVGLSRFAGGLPGISSPSDLYAAIMKSVRVKSVIIEKFDLMKEFKAKTVHDAFGELDRITKISISMEGIISVSVTHKNKYLAADVANSYIEELDKFNNETAMTAGKKYRIFIEKRLKENIDTLTGMEEKLRTFQEKHRTIALTTEIESAIATIAALKSQIILLEVKKGALSSSSRFDNPYLYDISKELRELKKQLQKIEFGGQDTTKNGFGAGFAVPFSELPEVSLEYARLFRDVKVQEGLYRLLTQQYEQAKIMELKDTPTVQILDKASPPEKKSWPKRSLIVIFAMFLSLFASIPLVFLLEYISNVKNKPEDHKITVQLMSTISQDFKEFKSKLSKFFKKRH